MSGIFFRVMSEQRTGARGRAARRFDYPMSGYTRITSRFDPSRLHPVLKKIIPHNGIDFSAPIGVNVRAIAAGVVSKVWTHERGGVSLRIDHADGYQSGYAHLSRVFVKPGERVAQGEVVAESGDTGVATAPHLHLTIRHNGVAVNPEPLLNA